MFLFKINMLLASALLLDNFIICYQISVGCLRDKLIPNVLAHLLFNSLIFSRQVLARWSRGYQIVRQTM